MDFVRRIFSLLMVLYAFSPASGALADHGIILGMSAAFTGPTRELGLEMYRGAQAYFDAVNAQGGVNGQRIDILPREDHYSPGPAIENTVKFVEEDDVYGLFGYVGTPTTTRAIPLLRRYARQDQLLLFPLTGAEQLRRPPYAQWIFHLRPSYYMETRGLVDNFMLAGRQRIAVFHQADAFGRSGWDGVRKSLSRFDLVISAEATYRRGATIDEDMTPQARLIARQSPDAVILVGASEACAAFIRDARDIGLDMPFGTLSFSNPEKLVRLLQELGEKSDRDYTQDLVATQVLPSYDDLSHPAAREYRKLMDHAPPVPEKLLGNEPYAPPSYSYPSFEGFLAAKLLAQAISLTEKAPTRAMLRRALESIRDYDLGIGERVSFGPDNHHALETVYFVTVENGRLVPLDSFRRWNK